MKIFDAFWKPSFYKSKDNKSFWRGLSRVIVVNFVIGVIYSVIFFVTIGKNIPAYFTSFTNQVISGYPDQLVLTLKDGVLSKNISGDLKLYPFTNVLSTVSTKLEANSNVPKYIISIDETKEASLSSYLDSDSFVFFGKNGAVTKSNNKIEVLSYKDMQGTKNSETFSKATLISIRDILDKYKGKVAPIAVVLIIVLYTIFMSIGYALLALFLGLTVMLLSKWVLTSKTKYSESYIYALYAIPSVCILQMILEQIPYISVVANIPLFTTLLTLAFLWYMFKKEEHKKTVDSASI